MLHAHLSIQGEYTAEVYSKDGTLLKTIGPYNNFITSTGLSFISKHAIADCFRFVSFGTSNQKNSINGGALGWGTSALTTPSKYTYIGSRTSESDPDPHPASQYTNASFKERPSGVSLTRGWRVPAGETNYFDNDYTFKEVMLSPGKPAVTGLLGSPTYFVPAVVSTLTSTILTYTAGTWATDELVGKYVYIIDNYGDNSAGVIRKITHNTATQIYYSAIQLSELVIGGHAGHFLFSVHDLFSVCACNEYKYKEDSSAVYGEDCASVAAYYNSRSKPICESTGAFVRIVKDIDVAKDNFLIFNYSLHVNVETGIHNFIITPIGQRGPQTTSNWSIHDLSGSHNLVHHGIKYISPGIIDVTTPYGQMPQIPSFDADSDFGESFVGSWGSPLEPSTPYQHLTAYLTTDNLQFYTNALEGGAYTAGDVGFLGRLSGLMLFRKSPQATIVSDGGFDPRLYNIRRTDLTTEAATPYWPISTNYNTETTNPASALPGFEVAALDQTFSTAVNYVNYADPSVRSRQVTRSFQFAGNTAQAIANFNMKPIRGIVLNYVGLNYETYHFPYLDCLFTDSGQSLNVDSLQEPQLVPTGYVPRSSFGDKSYSYWYYLDGLPSESPSPGMLTFSFVETWSSPCDPSVDGC